MPGRNKDGMLKWIQHNGFEAVAGALLSCNEKEKANIVSSFS